MTRVGFVTIGQSPRSDIMEEFVRSLAGAAALEAGALDGLNDAEVASFAPRGDDSVLVSRLRDGRSVRLAHRCVVPRVQACLDRLAAQGADLLVLLCTGDFPELVPPATMLDPRRVLPHVAAAALEGMRMPGRDPRLGVLVPDAAQIEPAEARWGGLAPSVVACASPYGGSSELAAAAAAVRAAGVSLTVMDCLGYTRAMQEIVARVSGVPAIFAAAAVSMIMHELLSGRTPHHRSEDGQRMPSAAFSNGSAYHG